jgi:outer membrane lipopolysaccharide assembly protein LptE/RlpB
MSKSMFVLAVLICLGLISGCGYVFKSADLEHIDTIRIAPIEILDMDFAYDNASQRPYDEVIREKLTQRFNRKWRDGNDSEFTMRIQDFDIREQGYGPQGEIEMLRMTLQIEYKFLDKVHNNMIAQTDNHRQVHDFYIVQGKAKPVETLEEAKRHIVDELVEDLYNQLAER